MKEPSPEFSDLLLPKELLKPFREVEEEYLALFIAGQGSVHSTNREEQERVRAGLNERERLSERNKIIKLLSKPCGCGNNCQEKFTVSAGEHHEHTEMYPDFAASAVWRLTPPNYVNQGTNFQ